MRYFFFPLSTKKRTARAAALPLISGGVGPPSPNPKPIIFCCGPANPGADLLLEFPELDGPEAAAMVCAAVYRLKRGVTLPVGEAVDAAALRLKAPRGWRSEPRPVLSRDPVVPPPPSGLDLN